MRQYTDLITHGASTCLYTCQKPNIQPVRTFTWIVCCCFTSQQHLVISGRLPTAHSQLLYSAAPLGNKATSTMMPYPTQSHYTDTELTCPCPILTMPGQEATSINFKIIDLTRPQFRFRFRQGSDFPISQNGRRTLQSFGHPVQCVYLKGLH